MFFTPDLSSIRTLHPRKEFHYWSPGSQEYASTCHLFSAVLRGWAVNSLVIRRTFELSGNRCTHVCYMELRRDGQYMTMPVIENPSLTRILNTNRFELVSYHEHLGMQSNKRIVRAS